MAELKILRYKIQYTTAAGGTGTVSRGTKFISFPTLAEARAFIRGLQYLDVENDYFELRPRPIYNEAL